MKQNREVTIPAPVLDYRPRDPLREPPAIALIGCGGITHHHLKAYAAAGYRVLALCDLDRERAEEKREQFYPGAAVVTDHREVLAREDIGVVDIATHPDVRPALVTAALQAGKHVLSQKPFVLDLDEGQRLIALADRCGRRLAVNQNARFAPHFRYIHRAAETGLLGDISAVDIAVLWDHDWVADTPFNEVEHLLLYDFAIHWFDFVQGLFPGQRAERVHAAVTRGPNQRSKQPLVGQVAIQFPAAQATLCFVGDRDHGHLDRTSVLGSEASIHSVGVDAQHQEVQFYTRDGRGIPTLDGAWFPDGFHGTMADLLCAIEEDREPLLSARRNLPSLELCFAACKSSLVGHPVVPGEVRRLPVAV